MAVKILRGAAEPATMRPPIEGQSELQCHSQQDHCQEAEDNPAPGFAGAG